MIYVRGRLLHHVTKEVGPAHRGGAFSREAFDLTGFHCGTLTWLHDHEMAHPFSQEPTRTKYDVTNRGYYGAHGRRGAAEPLRGGAACPGHAGRRSRLPGRAPRAAAPVSRDQRREPRTLVGTGVSLGDQSSGWVLSRRH